MIIKKITTILILFIITSIAGIAGCTSQKDNSYDINSTSSYNQSSKPSTELNNTLSTTKKYEASGYCNHVVDGDTIDVEGVGRIRFVGVNTPERGEAGYQESTSFVKNLCLGKIVYLDIDDAKHYDKYGRVLAVVYVDNINLNAELLKKGYAEVLYIPPSEFNPYSWA